LNFSLTSNFVPLTKLMDFTIFKSKVNQKLANSREIPQPLSLNPLCIYFHSSARLIIQLVQNSFCTPTVCCYGYQPPRLSRELQLIACGWLKGGVRSTDEWWGGVSKAPVLVFTRFHSHRVEHLWLVPGTQLHLGKATG